MEKYIYELDKLIKKSLKCNEVPVAALIIKNNRIISKAYNKRNKNKNLLDHAEIIAINKAAKKLKDWRLNNCVLYVTLEPCDMCKEIIKESRIEKVYYFLNKNKNVNKKTNFILVNNKYSDKYKNTLNKFFKEKR